MLLLSQAAADMSRLAAGITHRTGMRHLSPAIAMKGRGILKIIQALQWVLNMHQTVQCAGSSNSLSQQGVWQPLNMAA